MSETILSFLLGIGLSAAVGFRVFVPMLVVSLASMAGWITLSPGFQWMGTPLAALVFAVATLVELLGFLIPWVSNALDSIATPAAAIAVKLIELKSGRVMFEGTGRHAGLEINGEIQQIVD